MAGGPEGGGAVTTVPMVMRHNNLLLGHADLPCVRLGHSFYVRRLTSSYMTWAPDPAEESDPMRLVDEDLLEFTVGEVALPRTSTLAVMVGRVHDVVDVAMFDLRQHLRVMLDLESYRYMVERSRFQGAPFSARSETLHAVAGAWDRMRVGDARSEVLGRVQGMLEAVPAVRDFYDSDQIIGGMAGTMADSLTPGRPRTGRPPEPSSNWNFTMDDALVVAHGGDEPERRPTARAFVRVSRVLDLGP